MAHKCPSIHALLVRNGYVDEYVDHGNRSACGGKWELQKSAVHDNLVSFYASKVSLVSISVWVNSDISRNLPAIPWKTDIWFHFERIPLYQTPGLRWGRYDLPLWNFEWSTSWRNFCSDWILTLHTVRVEIGNPSFRLTSCSYMEEFFLSTSALKATWDWFGSIFWDVKVIFLISTVSFRYDISAQNDSQLSPSFFWTRQFVLQLSNMMRTKAGSSLALPKCQKKSAHCTKKLKVGWRTSSHMQLSILSF